MSSCIVRFLQQIEYELRVIRANRFFAVFNPPSCGEALHRNGDIDERGIKYPRLCQSDEVHRMRIFGLARGYEAIRSKARSVVSNYGDFRIRSHHHFAGLAFGFIIDGTLVHHRSWIFGAVLKISTAHFLRGWIYPWAASGNQPPNASAKKLQPDHWTKGISRHGSQQVENPRISGGVDD